MEQGFINFVNDRCIVRGDVRVSVSDIKGAYKIYSRDTNEDVIQSLLLFLGRRYENGLMVEYETGKPVYAIVGLKVRDIIIPRIYETFNLEEAFVFNSCCFSPRRKAVFECILDEYVDWKRRTGRVYNSDVDDDLLKNYLDSREQYILPAYIYEYRGDDGDGYYGIGLHIQSAIMRTMCCGDQVEKCDIQENVLTTYQNMRDALKHHGHEVSIKKMSKMIRDRTTIRGEHGVYFYRKMRTFF